MEKIEKIKGYIALSLVGLSCFNYGGYTYGVLNCGRIVEPHQWILTGLFGIYFLIYGITRFKNLKK